MLTHTSIVEEETVYLEKRPKVELDDKATYTGEWDKKANLKHGFGI